MALDADIHYDWNGEPLLDEYGQTIPSFICICCAYSMDECICGAWDIEIPNWDDE